MFGLICAGGVSQIWLSRVPGFRDRLGPVKGPGIRSASRVVNTLRAGWSVDQWTGLEAANVLFLAVPRRDSARQLELLDRASLDWTGRTLVAVDTELDVQRLRVFRERGAEVVALDRIVAGSLPCIVLQGNAAPLRVIRPLFPIGQFRLVEVAPGQRDAFLAGVDLASSFSLPLLAASADAFMATGVPATQAQRLAEDILSRTARSFLRGGKKTWSGALAEGDLEAIERRWEGLRSRHPGQAALLVELAAVLARHFGQSDTFARALEKIPGRHFARWSHLRTTGD